MSSHGGLSLDASVKKKSPDYLAQMRLKREKREAEALEQSLLDGSVVAPKLVSNQSKLQRLATNTEMTEYERAEALKRHANMIEEKARMQEKLLKMELRNSGDDAGGQFSHDTVEKTMAVNDMYIDAIQAKLKILDQL